MAAPDATVVPLGQPSNPPWTRGWDVGWFLYPHLGATGWMLPLGLFLLGREPLSGRVCLAGFVVVNVWGFLLWRARARVSLFAAFEWFFLVASVVFAVVIWVVRSRWIPDSPGSLVSTYLPVSTYAAAPAVMLWVFVLHRAGPLFAATGLLLMMSLTLFERSPLWAGVCVATFLILAAWGLWRARGGGRHATPQAAVTSGG